MVTEKAANFIKKNAEAAAKSEANEKGDDRVALQKHRWVPVTLESREQISEDTCKYTFRLPDGKNILGLGTCQHIQVGFHMKDKMLIRSYTPTRPLLPAAGSASGQESERDSKVNTNSGGNTDAGDASLRDGDGTFDLTVKTYFPNEDQPGGALSNILDCIPTGEEVEIRGPTGEILYQGSGKFLIEGKERVFRRVSLVLGGSGITPGYSLVARVLLAGGDDTELRVVDANKSERDILLKGELDEFEKKSDGQLRITHVLSHPGDGWKGEKGHVDAEILRKALFEPSNESVVFLCGPPAMIQKAALPNLKGEWQLRAHLTFSRLQC